MTKSSGERLNGKLSVIGLSVPPFVVLVSYLDLDLGRCSIGFHPLHSCAAVCAYLLVTVVVKKSLESDYPGP
jgi:hypothetical protein